MKRFPIRYHISLDESYEWAVVKEDDFNSRHLAKILRMYKKCNFNEVRAAAKIDFCLEPKTFSKEEMILFVVNGGELSLDVRQDKIKRFKTIKSEKIKKLIEEEGFSKMDTRLLYALRRDSECDELNPDQIARTLNFAFGKKERKRFSKSWDFWNL